MKAKLIKESLNEALRYSEGYWVEFAEELIDYEGWKDEGDCLIKYHSTDEGETIETRIYPGQGSDHIDFELVDEEGNIIDGGSFDAEGLGTGEFDGELSYHIK